MFAAFTAAVLAPLVVAAIAYPLAPVVITAEGAVCATLAVGIGYLLYRRAGRRWERRVQEI